MQIATGEVKEKLLPDTRNPAAVALSKLGVTGAEILDGIKVSSGRSFSRADSLLSDYVSDGSLLKTGVRRGIRYRLSNQGFAKAQTLAKELIATVA